MGFDTSVNLSALLALRKRVTEWLHGEQFGGAIWRAGMPKAA